MPRFRIVRDYGSFPDLATAEMDARLRYGPDGYVRVVSEASDKLGVDDLQAIRNGERFGKQSYNRGSR